MGQGEVACPKPMSRKRLKGRKDRAERKVKKSVRAQCVARDGFCRLARPWREPLGVGGCNGKSEWAHLEEQRRFKTRGQAPDQRHNTANSMMLCSVHHRLYDARKIRLGWLTPFGADGLMLFRFGMNTVREDFMCGVWSVER